MLFVRNYENNNNNKDSLNLKINAEKENSKMENKKYFVIFSLRLNK